MAFIQNPLYRQRWNHISQTTETVTENAAAGIWTFQHRYITPCLSSVADTLDSCTSLCTGADREERARRARERDRGARRSMVPEYAFDFYDDWADDFPEYEEDFLEGSGGGQTHGHGGGGGGGGILGRITGEDWDRLLAGTGGGRRRGGDGGDAEVTEQPRRKRGMSYGTRGTRKVSRASAAEDDPTVIPSTAPLGFLARLPFKIGGTLRYKPSAANLKEHPGQGQQPVRQRDGMEGEPLLGGTREQDEAEEGFGEQVAVRHKRQRSDTTGSGATSDSFRSRNDLFPSDGEGEEDAVPLDDEFAVALDRVDDRGSNKTRRSSKGKRVERRSSSGLSLNLTRTVSRTTIGSNLSRESPGGKRQSVDQVDGIGEQTLDELQREEELARLEEEEEVERKRRRAAQLAAKRGLSRDDLVAAGSEANIETTQKGPVIAEPERLRVEDTAAEHNVYGQESMNGTVPEPGALLHAAVEARPEATEVEKPPTEFVPARLPHFG